MIKINDKILEQKQFPDGTLHIDLPVVEGIITVTWLYESDAELFTLMCINDHYPRHKKILQLPYVPHARMDRVKNPTDVFTLKTFCKAINSMDFSGVIVTDPHSNVTPALLDKVTVISPVDTIQKAFNNAAAKGIVDLDDLVLFFPDDGAAKRYSDSFTQPHTHGIKKRDWNTGRIESLVIANPDVVKGKEVFIIDDICSYGGTFARAGKALKEAGAKKVALFVTHCEPNIFKGSVFEEGNVDFVMTTNSLLQKSDVPEDFDETDIYVMEVF